MKKKINKKRIVKTIYVAGIIFLVCFGIFCIVFTAMDVMNQLVGKYYQSK